MLHFSTIALASGNGYICGGSRRSKDVSYIHMRSSALDSNKRP